MAKKRKAQWRPTADKVMSPEEAKRLRDVLLARDVQDRAAGRRKGVVRWAVIDVAMTAGLRVSEIAALKVGDVRLTGSRPLLIVRNGKGGKKRTIPLSGPTAELKDHLADFLEWKEYAGEPTDPDAPLFTAQFHGEWPHYTTAALKYSFKQALKDAGIPPERYSIHCARHTALTRIYERRKDLRLVQYIAGHSDISMSAHYAVIVDAGRSLDDSDPGPSYW